MKVKPDLLLNDAVTIPEVVIPQVPIIKGDAKSVSIAAASIVAKVTRDRLMEEYDKVLPGYGFASNKGYGSALVVWCVILIAIITAVQFIGQKKWVTYDV